MIIFSSLKYTCAKNRSVQIPPKEASETPRVEVPVGGLDKNITWWLPGVIPQKTHTTQEKYALDTTFSFVK